MPGRTKAPSISSSSLPLGTVRRGSKGQEWKVIQQSNGVIRWQRLSKPNTGDLTSPTTPALTSRPPYTARVDFRVTVFNTNSNGMVEAVRRLKETIKPNSTDCIVFPEMFVTDTVDVDRKIEDVAAIRDAEIAGRLLMIGACMALNSDCLICGRDYTKEGWYNTAWYVDRTGRILNRYDKQKILSCEADPRYDPSKPELQQLTGNKPPYPTFDIPSPSNPACFIGAAILICADLEREDLLEYVALEEPQIIFNPASVMPYSTTDAAYMIPSVESAKKSFIKRLLPALKHSYIVRTDFPFPAGGMTSMILKPTTDVADAVVAWPPTFAKEWIHTEVLPLKCNPAIVPRPGGEGEREQKQVAVEESDEFAVCSKGPGGCKN